MRKNKPHRLSFSTKLRLKKLHRTSIFSQSLRGLETEILLEMKSFSNETEIPKIHPFSLILGESKTNRKLDARTKKLLILRVIRTRGQLRWLCFWFFTPVSEKAYQITRTKLFLKILFDFQKFSREVLSRLYLVETNTESLITIPLWVYSNPNSGFSLKIGEKFLLESEYSLALHFWNRGTSQLREYKMGQIILYDSNCAISLIQKSNELNKSIGLQRFIDSVPEFKQKLESRSKVIVTFHSSAGDTLDERLEKQKILSSDTVMNAQIWHQRFILTDNSWLLIDETCSPQLEFVAGHWQFLEQAKSFSGEVLLEKPSGGNQINLEEALYLIGRADENWYHLLLDTLPRYLWFESLDKNIPVLVRGDLPKTSMDILSRLISRPLIFVQPNDIVFVTRLHFVAGRSTVFDSKPLAGQERVKFSPKNLNKTKNWFLENSHASTEIEFPRKILIKRTAKYRNLINSKKVIRELEERGYDILECTEEFFLNQCKYFARADHVVAPGGAVLANMLFMEKGSTVTVIRSSRDSDLGLWQKLAQACGIEFTEVVGVPTYFGPRTLARQHSNYFLPPRKLKKIFDSQN